MGFPLDPVLSPIGVPGRSLTFLDLKHLTESKSLMVRDLQERLLASIVATMSVRCAGLQQLTGHFPNAACAAANLAIGTRKGLQLT